MQTLEKVWNDTLGPRRKRLETETTNWCRRVTRPPRTALQLCDKVGNSFRSILASSRAWANAPFGFCASSTRAHCSCNRWRFAATILRAWVTRRILLSFCCLICNMSPCILICMAGALTSWTRSTRAHDPVASS